MGRISNIAGKGQKHIKKIRTVDKDTESFNQIMHAFRLPDSDSKEKQIKEEAIKKLPFMRLKSLK